MPVKLAHESSTGAWVVANTILRGSLLDKRLQEQLRSLGFRVQGFRVSGCIGL